MYFRGNTTPAYVYCPSSGIAALQDQILWPFMIGSSKALRRLKLDTGYDQDSYDDCKILFLYTA